MCQRLYKYLYEEKLLHSKQFGFQKDHFTDHAIIHLIYQIYESFENGNYTLGVFIDLSKSFDTVDHSILLKKVEMYGVIITNLAWFASYLNGWKQYTKIYWYSEKGYQVWSATRLNTRTNFIFVVCKRSTQFFKCLCSNNVCRRY